MDQIEAVSNVLEVCASLLRRMAVDGAADMGDALFAASDEMENAARRHRRPSQVERHPLQTAPRPRRRPAAFSRAKGLLRRHTKKPTPAYRAGSCLVSM